LIELLHTPFWKCSLKFTWQIDRDYLPPFLLDSALLAALLLSFTPHFFMNEMPHQPLLKMEVKVLTAKRQAKHIDERSKQSSGNDSNIGICSISRTARVGNPIQFDTYSTDPLSDYFAPSFTAFSKRHSSSFLIVSHICPILHRLYLDLPHHSSIAS